VFKIVKTDNPQTAPKEKPTAAVWPPPVFVRHKETAFYLLDSHFRNSKITQKKMKVSSHP